ncbi:MAG: tetratricopeptide repeat protein [Planctomycetaceae bacterium]|jgi:tetratricopeptide (TPR) repeat protein|nr:tetratricopeptide repeat protein [Planctomycetaceae bacterium]
MAKRPATEEEDEVPKIRKRRRPQKKAGDEEDGTPPSGGTKGNKADEDDDEDGEGSISTGNVFLDIVLDFRDDCLDWAKDHFLYAIIISSAAFIIFAVISSLVIYSWVRYFNRPSLADVIKKYDSGAFPEAKFAADYALEYVPPKDFETRCAFLFFQGAATIAVAERAAPADQRDLYLTAANYLKESARYGFVQSRTAEGWFLLGKALFHCGELLDCRQPLLIALDDKYPHTKEIYWYLAGAYYFGAAPDLQRSRQWLKKFQTEPTALEEELAESHLLEAMINLQLDGIEAAEESFRKVPHFEAFEMMRHLVEGEIEFYKGRRYRQMSIDLKNNPNPVNIPDLPAPNGGLLPSDPAPGDPEPAVGIFDADSDLQKRVAEMRSKYAQDANNVTKNPPAGDVNEEDRIIVLPKTDSSGLPSPEDTPKPPPAHHEFDSDPVLKRAAEFRDIADEHYRKALAHFAEVIRLSTYQPDWGRIARLLTGICYAEMEEAQKARQTFHHLMETFPSSQETAAAAFMAGEYERTMGNPDAAYRAFDHAFENLRHDPNYASYWLPKSEMIDRCTGMVRSDIDAQRHADAMKILNAARGVMEPAMLARMTGETCEDWASALRRQTETAFGERRIQLTKEAELKMRSAGAAFRELAEILSATPEYSGLLWRSAEDYRLGKDYRNGIIGYKKFLQSDFINHRPEVYLAMGELYLHLDLLEESARCLEDALHEYPSDVLVPQIRLALSRTLYEQKEWDKAKSLLKLNLIGEFTPESLSYRDAMYRLGKISYEQGNIDEAIPYLEDAVKIHPEAEAAADAHYALSKTYLRRADKQFKESAGCPTEALRQMTESAAQQDQQRGLAHIEKTVSILEDRRRTAGLTEAENLMYRNAQFQTAFLLMRMKEYLRAVPMLNNLATKYQDRPEALDALIAMAVALRLTGRETESETTLNRAEVILNQLEQNGKIADGTNWRNTINRQRKR